MLNINDVYVRLKSVKRGLTIAKKAGDVAKQHRLENELLILKDAFAYCEAEGQVVTCCCNNAPHVFDIIVNEMSDVKKHVATKYTGKCSYGSLQSTASDGGCYRVSYGSGRAALNIDR